MTDARPTPATRVLVLASWFPSVDESSRGRFVADQVQALAAGDRVVPIVVSYDAIGFAGAAETPADEAEAVTTLTARAIARRSDLFSRAAVHAPAGVPVARLAIPAGVGGSPGDAPVGRREAVLEVVRPFLGSVDVVHAHTGFPDGAAAAGLAERLRAPLIITEHASFVAQHLADPVRRDAYLRGARTASRLVTVSEMLAGELRSAMPDYAEKVVVVPNAVDVDAFTPLPLAERQPDELVYVGYRVESKGIPLLLESFREVRRRRPTATLRLIGRSTEHGAEERWHEMAATLGILDAVTFDPPALRPAVARALARADLLVHASPRETFGMTAAEALASGTPVVALDSGGVTEIVGRDGTLGEIVDDPDPAAFAAAILRTLDRRSSFDPDALRRSVVDRFGSRRVADRIADLYEEVRDGRLPPTEGERRAIRPDPGPADRDVGHVPDRSVLVVGFLASRTERLLRSFPRAMLSRVDVLTAPAPGVEPLPGGLAHVTVVDIDGPYRVALGRHGDRPRARSLRARIGRLLEDPLGVVRRRRIRSRRERYRADAARNALRDLVAGRTEPLWTDVVGVTGLDYLAIASVPEIADRVAPGGLRWLADSLAGDGEGPTRTEPATKGPSSS